MALGKCRECGKQLSTEAATCPHCGLPEPTQAKGSTGLSGVASPFSRQPSQRPTAKDTSETGRSAQPAQMSQVRLRASESRFNFTLIHGLLAVMLLAMGGIFWYGLTRRAGAPSSPVTSAVQAVQPSKPSMTPQERQLAAEAVEALSALRSVTQAGLTYRDYSPRVLDTKVKVDRYLTSSASGRSADLRENVEIAMRLYVFASEAWNAKIRNEGGLIADHPAVDLCPALRSFRDSNPDSRGYSVASGVPLIWVCASDKLREAERALLGS